VSVIIDSSVWVAYFKGQHKQTVEEILYTQKSLLPPLVISEVLSGEKRLRWQRPLKEFLSMVPMVQTDREHWERVGELRCGIQKQGLAISTPDAHVAQCALDTGSVLFSFDKIFEKISPLCGLKLFKV
jgi:predicted nucleic acid-binding protein